MNLEQLPAEAAPNALLAVAERVAGLFARHHRARLVGAGQLPGGPALLVGNHGIYGYETPIFFYLLRQATGRYPTGLAERGMFRLPLVRRLLPRLGGVEGSPPNAVRALRRGHMVVVYPGGAREVFKDPNARYQLHWGDRLGFVRVAARAGVPVVPFGAKGVDDTFALVPKRRAAVRLAAHADYHAPIGLPLGVAPFPARLTFALGAPMDPPAALAAERELRLFRDEVAGRVRQLIRSAADE